MPWMLVVEKHNIVQKGNCSVYRG